MKVTKYKKLASGFLSVGLGLGVAMTSLTSQASTLVLEGSDATGYHHDATYTSQLFSFMKDGSALPILVFGSVVLTGAPGDTIYTTDLTGLDSSLYSGIYIQSPGGCCDDNRTGALTFETEIASFVAAGRSLSIQDYQGGDWGTILDFNAPSSVIGGYGGGAGGPGCFDTEIFTADALSKGFTQPGSLGCWGHQAYDMAYFGALGFLSLVDSGPEFAALGSGSWSSFLALGGSLGTPTGVPEPSTLFLLGLGLLGFAFPSIRRSSSKK
jgi:PEP-CTERM motif